MSSYARHPGAMASHGSSPNFSPAQLMALVSHPGAGQPVLPIPLVRAGSAGTNSRVATLFADRFTNWRQVVAYRQGGRAAASPAHWCRWLTRPALEMIRQIPGMAMSRHCQQVDLRFAVTVRAFLSMILLFATYRSCAPSSAAPTGSRGSCRCPGIHSARW